MFVHAMSPLIDASVSILVFVELALDEFQYLEIWQWVFQQFQSLFSWNLLLMLASSCLNMSSIWFQSLFSWNLLLMSGFFSFFFPFDTVKPPILSPPLA